MAERALSADQVVRAALALLDEVGLRGFTMRALADRLETYPATIYWHVGNRTEVLSAVGDMVLDEAMGALPDPDALPWDEWLAGRSRRTWSGRRAPARRSKARGRPCSSHWRVAPAP